MLKKKQKKTSHRKIEVAPYIEYTPIYASYENNELIKPKGTEIEYTPQMLAEFKKCSEDPLYFISNYYYIVELDKGLKKIDLWDFQYEFIDHLHNNRFSIVLASRQVGKSVITIAYILWYILFNSYKEVAVLSKTGPDAFAIMEKLQRSYEQIPQWLQQNVTKWAGGFIKLENGCSVYSRATTINAGRSASANILFLDEFAFIPQNIASKFYTSAYPIISNSTTSKVIICSTPQGHNHFYHMQRMAELGENEYKRLVITWDSVPGRDRKWKEQTIRNLSLEKGGDGESKFAQEYELQFENYSVKAVISGKLQKKIAEHISSNVHECYPDIIKEVEELVIFEEPEIDENGNYTSIYMLTADVGKGVGDDNSAFSVIKLEKDKYKQVAVYKNNQITAIAFAEIIQRISEYYNDAYILVENNNQGASTVDHLWYTLETDNLLHSHGPSTDHLKYSVKDKEQLGVQTNIKTRSKGISKLQEFLKYGILEINDFETLQELSQFTLQSGKFKAEPGYHDDLVMGLVIFCYFTTDKGFSSISDNIDNVNNKIRQELNNENPFLLNYDNIYAGLDDEPETIVSIDDFFVDR